MVANERIVKNVEKLQGGTPGLSTSYCSQVRNRDCNRWRGWHKQNAERQSQFASNSFCLDKGRERLSSLPRLNISACVSLAKFGGKLFGGHPAAFASPHEGCPF